MGRAMMAGQLLPSGCGFKVVSIKDVVIWPENNVNFKETKEWCRKNCSGIWGYTPYPRQSRVPCSEKPTRVHGQYEYVNNYYFAFVDSEDITMIALFLSLDDRMVIKSMWPSSAKFNIFYDTDDDVVEYDSRVEDLQ